LALMEASDSLAGAPFLVFTLIASAFTIHLNQPLNIIARRGSAFTGCR